MMERYIYDFKALLINVYDVADSDDGDDITTDGEETSEEGR